MMVCVIYFGIGFFLAGIHFASQEHRCKPKREIDLLPPVYRLSIVCAFVVAPFWPAYLLMLAGAVFYRNLPQ